MTGANEQAGDKYSNAGFIFNKVEGAYLCSLEIVHDKDCSSQPRAIRNETRRKVDLWKDKPGISRRDSSFARSFLVHVEIKLETQRDKDSRNDNVAETKHGECNLFTAGIKETALKDFKDVFWEHDLDSINEIKIIP
jgi:hypothetical protein